MELSAKQLKAIALISAGSKFTSIAKALGIAEKTLFIWRQLPEFKRALKDYQYQMYQEALGKLRTGAKIAADTLIEITQDKESSASARVRACEVILSHAKPESTELDELKAINLLVESGVLPDGIIDAVTQESIDFHKKTKEVLNGKLCEIE